MLRVVERVLGEGDLVREGQLVLRAGYELTLYQHWSEKDGTLQPGHYEVEGHLLASSDALERALGTAAPLTLHLDDGRRFDLFVINTEGTITGADQRGLYTKPEP
jgi:hypothetical protein